MGIAVTSLTPVERTALLTVYARALDSRRPRSILRDTWADSAVTGIDYDFAALGVQTSVVCQTALRAKMLDARVSAFTAAHPDAVVVDLGGGLDSGFHRVAHRRRSTGTPWTWPAFPRCVSSCCRRIRALGR